MDAVEKARYELECLMRPVAGGQIVLAAADAYALAVLDALRAEWVGYLADDSHVCPYQLEKAAQAIRARLSASAADRPAPAADAPG